MILITNRQELEGLSFHGLIFNKFKLWPNVNDSNKIQYLKNQLLNYPGEVYAAVKNDRICSLIAFRKLDWDSEYFGFLCYKIDYFLTNTNDSYEVSYNICNDLLDMYINYSQRNKIKFTYCSFEPSEIVIIDSLRNKRFSFILTWLDGVYNPKKNKTPLYPDIETKVESINPSEIEYFQKLSSDYYFDGGRFFLDRNFDQNKVRKMYSDLVINSFQAKDTLLVYKLDDRPIGLFICKKIQSYQEFENLKVSALRFLIVDPKYRGVGNSTDFFSKTLNYLNQYSDIVTTGLEVHNLPSLNLHSRVNFKFNYVHQLYHLWH